MAAKLYRYISFETLVGMIQSQALTFVLPEVWDDPKEYAPYENYISHLDNLYEKILFECLRLKTYCQCWTRLAESDAMWRIYSYNNHAVRLRISQDKIKLLDGVQACPVAYSDDFEISVSQGEDAVLKTLALKRTAFKHEKEVRLVKHYKFSGTDDAEKHIKAYLAISEHPQRLEIVENLFPNQSIKEQVEGIVKILNIGNGAQKKMDVSFSHIPGFIEGVLVHPLAPAWYVDIVREFCERNNVPFEGKSTLYSE